VGGLVETARNRGLCVVLSTMAENICFEILLYPRETTGSRGTYADSEVKRFDVRFSAPRYLAPPPSNCIMFEARCFLSPVPPPFAGRGLPSKSFRLTRPAVEEGPQAPGPSSSSDSVVDHRAKKRDTSST